MRAALRTHHLYPAHAEAPVFLIRHGSRKRLVERRPAGAGIELRVGGEQRIAARGAVERTSAILMEKLPGKRHFRPLLPQRPILFRSQFFFPLPFVIHSNSLGVVPCPVASRAKRGCGTGVRREFFFPLVFRGGHLIHTRKYIRRSFCYARRLACRRSFSFTCCLRNRTLFGVISRYSSSDMTSSPRSMVRT